MVRANAIKDSKLVSYLRRLADVVIEPNIKNIHWADFGAYDRCIAAGVEAARQALPRIRQLLRHERVMSVLRPAEGKRLAEAHLEGDDMGLCLE
jgi:NTE family protein